MAHLLAKAVSGSAKLWWSDCRKFWIDYSAYKSCSKAGSQVWTRSRQGFSDSQPPGFKWIIDWGCKDRTEREREIYIYMYVYTHFCSWTRNLSTGGLVILFQMLEQEIDVICLIHTYPRLSKTLKICLFWKGLKFSAFGNLGYTTIYLFIFIYIYI